MPMYLANTPLADLHMRERQGALRIDNPPSLASKEAGFVRRRFLNAQHKQQPQQKSAAETSATAHGD